MNPRERLTALLQPLTVPGGARRTEAALTGLADAADNALVARLHCSAAALALALSTQAGGQWIAGAGGLVWLNGRQVTYLVDVHQLERVMAARRAAAALGAPASSWTVGGVARACLKWAVSAHRHRRGQDGWLRGCPWAYTKVLGGRYPHATLCDLSAAYWQALCRLESPWLDWLPSGPAYHPLPDAENERWRALLAAVETCKPLRLCLVGCMLGGGTGGHVYCRGQRLQQARRRGPLVTAALVVVRSVYELTWLQAEAGGAVYANTDAVILPEHGRPGVWERYGYRYRVEAEGPAHVVHLGAYQVGERMTAPYGAGARYPIPERLSPAPEPLILPLWH